MAVPGEIHPGIADVTDDDAIVMRHRQRKHASHSAPLRVALGTLINLIVGGKLPLNTSGGNLAECYMHGFGLVLEGVRQIFGKSTSQVKDAKVSMVTAGPMVAPVSGCIFGGEDVL